MRGSKRSSVCGTGLIACVGLWIGACTDMSTRTGSATQEAVAQIPRDLNPALNARRTLVVGALAVIRGDIISSGNDGSIVYQPGANQAAGGSTVAQSVEIQVTAHAARVFGNDLLIAGKADEELIGVDPEALPQVPGVTPAAPGATNVTAPANRQRQLCAGQYGAIALQANSTLNLNGGVYHLTRLTLAEGARLLPSEPVVLVVSGNVTIGSGASIGPYQGAINPMSARDIRIESHGAIVLNDSSNVRAHLLASNGRITLTNGATLTGSAWANHITLGVASVVQTDGEFNLEPIELPPACNDNNACTTDACVGGGTATGLCRSTPVPSGTSCEDGSLCNGAEFCNSAGTCLPGSNAPFGTSCADGTVCNGDERCDGGGTCATGTPPVIDDDNACTNDACDPTEGPIHVPAPDGSPCGGSGTCQAGECSEQSLVYSQQFFSFTDITQQCNAWNEFRDQLTMPTFSRVTMSGTFDTVGVTCDEPSAATRLCRAMRTGEFVNVFCNGRSWSVGDCSGVEISASGTVCDCDFPGYRVRPCTNSSSWGGVNTSTCSSPTQTMTVECEF